MTATIVEPNVEEKLDAADAVLSQLPSRFSGILCPTRTREARVLIAGVGAVGRRVAELVLPTRPDSMVLVDPDEVGVENVVTQGFPLSDVGALKVQAVGAQLKADFRPDTTRIFMEGEIVTPRLIERYKPTHLFMCVDSLQARRDIEKMSRACWLFDGRIGGESAIVAVRPPASIDDPSKYTRSIPDGDGADLPCTSKMAHYAAAAVAAILVAEYSKSFRPESFPPAFHRFDWLVACNEFIHRS